MRRLLLAGQIALALIALAASPGAAQVAPVAVVAPEPGPELVPGPGPYETSPEGCVVPALASVETRCLLPRTPGDARGSACTLPVVYLGGEPAPCPERQGPPKSRIIPVVPTGVSR